MIVHMTHPLHGEMDVYTEAEVTANEKNGWIRKQEIPAVEQSNNKPADVSEIVRETLAKKRYEDIFGKKPHHRMSLSTIEAALKE